AHEDAVMPSDFAGVVDVHDGQFQCLGEVADGQSAHVPLVRFAPHVPGILDHAGVWRVPPNQMSVFFQEVPEVVSQQIEALVQVGPFEAYAELTGDILAGSSTHTWVGQQATSTTHVRTDEVFDDAASAVAPIGAFPIRTTVGI